jgi:hypothetical protein
MLDLGFYHPRLPGTAEEVSATILDMDQNLVNSQRLERRRMRIFASAGEWSLIVIGQPVSQYRAIVYSMAGNDRRLFAASSHITPADCFVQRPLFYTEELFCKVWWRVGMNK